MYESYYGLEDKPFSMLPDPGFLYLSRKHETALTLLEYGLMNSAGFCVITGSPGAGKTTLLRKLLDSVDDNVAVGMITNTHKSFGDLLDWVLAAFNLSQPNITKVAKNQIFVDFLLHQYACKRTTLLIVDEAQNMHPDILEELRMLSNINSEKDLLLQVILAGQPELKDILRRPELMQFAQRISVDYHLAELNLEETCGYIQHRLTVAGASRDVFTPKACERIFQYSGGTPRLINLICDTALVYGFADHDEIIDEKLIDLMVKERMRDSVVPLFKGVAVDAEQEEEEAQSTDEIDFPHIDPLGGSMGLKPEQVPEAEEEAPLEEIADEVDEQLEEQAAEESIDPADESAEDASEELSASEADTEIDEQPAEEVADEEPARMLADNEPVSTVDLPESDEDHPTVDQLHVSYDVDPEHLKTLKLKAYRADDRRWRWTAASVVMLLLLVAGVFHAGRMQAPEDPTLDDQTSQEAGAAETVSDQLEGEIERILAEQQAITAPSEDAPDQQVESPATSTDAAANDAAPTDADNAAALQAEDATAELTTDIPTTDP